MSLKELVTSSDQGSYLRNKQGEQCSGANEEDATLSKKNKKTYNRTVVPAVSFLGQKG